MRGRAQGMLRVADGCVLSASATVRPLDVPSRCLLRPKTWHPLQLWVAAPVVAPVAVVPVAVAPVAVVPVAQAVMVTRVVAPVAVAVVPLWVLPRR